MILEPKEKAQELMEKFSIYTTTGSEDDVFVEYRKANKYFNKNACLLCVDEIIKAEPTRYSAWERISTEDYWQQVKQELLKM